MKLTHIESEINTYQGDQQPWMEEAASGTIAVTNNRDMMVGDSMECAILAEETRPADIDHEEWDLWKIYFESIRRYRRELAAEESTTPQHFSQVPGLPMEDWTV